MLENHSPIPMLTLLLFIPLAGVLGLAFIPAMRKTFLRAFALGVTGIEFVLSVFILSGFDSSTHQMQFVEKVSWIPEIGITYFLGVDGLSLLLVLLTTFIAVISVLCSWSAVAEKVKGYMACILIMETGMIGVFVALDLVVFFLFWEVGLIPMYFLIGIWGGDRKLYAAIKFFLYTLFGSIFMLVGILAIYHAHGNATGEFTFNLLKLYEVAYPGNLQRWVFLAFFLGFAVKVPIFPFHTWLPDAHVEAPTAGSVILAAVLLKMGTYAFLRFNLPLLPSASIAFAPFIFILAVIGIIYGAFLALAQNDLKKLVAYSSISHLGFVMAGIFALNQQGIDGAILQMLNHGISTGALFVMVGIIYERSHSKRIEDLGGIAGVMPVFAALLLIVSFSSIGLPGTNGFIGEVLILVGVFKASAPAAVLAASGIVLAAVYMLWMYQRVIFGNIRQPESQSFQDLNAREILTLAPVIILILWIGLYPKPFLKLTSAGTLNLIQVVERKHSQISAQNEMPVFKGHADTSLNPFYARGVSDDGRR
jgi:NADH-quinone oxidoreductase subunit M